MSKKTIEPSINIPFLSDLQKGKIEAFCADREMYEAVRKVLLSGLYESGTLPLGRTPDPLQNAAFHLASLAIENPIPDEQIGAQVRAMFAGLNALAVAYNRLDGIKLEKPEVVKEAVNEAI
jgi:hypothetical protein